MKTRTLLTCVWLIAFLIALLLIELMIHYENEDGLLLLLEEDRLGTMKPVIQIYAGYLGGLLAFWFLRPFPKAKTDEAERFRFRLALACTAFFNLVVIYMIARAIIWQNMPMEDYLSQTTTLAALLSFLVAPVNLYYFGMKMAE
jgi:hypothetical protein